MFNFYCHVFIPSLFLFNKNIWLEWIWLDFHLFWKYEFIWYETGSREGGKYIILLYLKLWYFRKRGRWRSRLNISIKTTNRRKWYFIVSIIFIEINLEEDEENDEMIESFLKCSICEKKPSDSNAAEIPVYTRNIII